MSPDWYRDLGDPARVSTVDELEAEGSLYAAVRVAQDPHLRRHVRRSCAWCEARVWVERGYVEAADRLVIVCVPCLDAEAAKRRSR